MTTIAVLQSLEPSPDGSHVVIASSDTTARVHDSATGKPAGPPLHHPVIVRVAGFNRDGRRVVTADAAQNVRVWDWQTGDLLVPPLSGRAAGNVLRVWFSRDDQRMVFRGGSGKTIQWDLPTLNGATVPSADLVNLLAGRMIDETQGIAFLGVTTFRDDTERYRKAWLSSLDGGRLRQGDRQTNGAGTK
jgi:WD40 repeat protein